VFGRRMPVGIRYEILEQFDKTQLAIFGKMDPILRYESLAYAPICRYLFVLCLKLILSEPAITGVQLICFRILLKPDKK
jgi:hypothetical protein